MRPLLAVASLLLAASPLAAQTALPDGWRARTDRNAPMDQVRFVKDGEAFDARMGPAAIFYHPGSTATGLYTARATFTQRGVLPHAEAYGLLIGGKNLDAADQDYLYFLVRQDGKYLVKHRAGEETHTLVEWTAHEAIARPGEDGRATNALAVDVGRDAVRFLVNGTEVGKLERVPYLNVDGIVGLRINHRLDVRVEDFGIDPAGK